MRGTRLILVASLAMPLAHCSCQRTPDAAMPDPPADPATATSSTTAPATTDGAAQAASPASPVGEAREAVSTLHQYLGLLPGNDTARADAFWGDAGPGNPADDALLRELPGLRAMRIDTDRPLPLDRNTPPGAWEIPVRLRVDSSSGSRWISGHYRLRTRLDGKGWEITSAQLQPADPPAD